MPFDLEDVLPGLDVPRFKAAPANEQKPDDVAGVVHCNCPVCSGALSVIEGVPTDPQGLNAEERGGPVPGGHPSKTIPEAAFHLNRTYATWNDFWKVDGVSDVDNNWDQYWGGAPSVVTFAFRSTMVGAMPDDTTGFTRFTETQINAALLALQSWADVANVVFVRVGEGTTGNAAYSNDATILFSNYASGADGAAAFAFYPSLSASGGDVWVNYSLNNNKNPAQGNYGMLTLVHEIGHAIGFSHPGDYNAGEGTGPITYADDAEYYEDSHQYTVMSYFTEDNTGAYYGVAYPAAPQLDDIAAAQRSYGVNTTTRTGDTVYGFNSTAGRPWFSISNTTTAAVFAVWDAGGVDTFDFSGYSQNQLIDLRQGHFSNVGQWTGNVAIAMGAIIENAIGGFGADTIIGNASANTLTGNGGADTLTGGAGADIFVVTIGGGADIVTDFTVGSDKIQAAVFGSYVSIAQNGANTVVTFSGGVTLTLLGVTASTVTAASFMFDVGPPPAGYNLINGTAADEALNGTSASDQIYGKAGNDDLIGNDANDWLEGGEGNDYLNGGAGDDMMKGGVGNDVYIVDSAGDTITELAGEGTDTVQVFASYTLGANFEQLLGMSFTTGMTLTGNELDNLVQGNDVADVLNGAGGADTLTGGGGADVFVVTVGGGADTVTDFAVGTDKIDATAFGAYQSIVQNGADTVITFAAGVTLTLNGVTASTVTNASFIGLTPYNVINGTNAGETINGTTAADQIFGLAGDDALNGAGGDDWLEGGGNNDVLNGGAGADTMKGGNGNDGYIVDDAGDVVVELAGEGVDNVSTTLASYTLTAEVEHLTGSDGVGQVLTGNSLANAIGGQGGDDTLNGAGGDDHLDGGAGADAMTGGAGNDDFVVDNAGDTTVEVAGGGVDIVYTTLAAWTLAAEIENLTGLSGAGQSLTGNGLANTIVGGAGADTLNGAGGADAMTGAAGNDTYVVDNAGDTVTELAGGGADTVQTSLASYTLSAQLENLTGTVNTGQTLTGNASANVITGGSGADTLNGLGGADAMTGGAGNDTYVVDNAGDTTVEVGGGGSDTVQTTLASYSLAAEIENLTGAVGTGQALTGNSLNNIIVGGAGADTIAGGAGTDTLTGGGAADIFVASVGGGADTVTDFVVGTDKIDVTAFSGYQAIVQSGADTLITVASGVTIRLTGITASTVTAASFVGIPTGPTVINGTTGNNILNGTSGEDHIFGLAGNDTLHGLEANDWIEGDLGIDKLYGDDGADKLEGGDGADTLDGGTGADEMIGGIGDDTYVVDNAGDVVTEAAAAGTDTVQTGLSTYTLGATLENLTGTAAGAQTLTGNAVANTISGGAAGDTLAGLDGDDKLYGAGGTDQVDGGDGADKLYGDDGDDAVTGGLGADYLYGGADNDTLSGGADLDRLFGDDGDDTLAGDDGNDVIQGGLGADRITGGAGNDTLTGGDGADVFVATIGGGADSVADFVVGTDKIDLTTFGGYLTLAQNGTDTLITFAAGTTLRLKGVTASTVTNASFIGLPSGPTYNVITGTSAGEALNGTAAADHIQGLGGADTITGGGAADLLEGGAGNDVFVATVGGGADTIGDFTVGSDKIDVTAFGAWVGATQQGADTLVTVSAGVTFLLLNTTASAITNASFIGLPGGPPPDGYNLINGTAGADDLIGTGASDQIYGLGGADSLFGSDANDWLEGGEGDDYLIGSTGDDVMKGGAGNDTYIVGEAGDLTVELAGEGTDRVDTILASYTLQAEIEMLVGTLASAQTLVGNGIANTIAGATGADSLSGMGGDDRLEGRQGDDTLTGGAGADVFVITNGGGADTVTDFVVGTDKIDVSLFGAYQSIVQSGADTLVTVAAGLTIRLLGVTAAAVTDASFIGLPSTGYNVITGTGATESINGTTGADHIFGLGGVDTIKASDGDDWIEGGEGDDRLYGDFGNDLIQGGVGADQMFGRLGFDELDGGDGADKLYGDEGDDALTGGLGADFLYGGEDNDTLSGGDDLDRLYGDDGDDVIDGGAGNDIIQGGLGADQITGGAGNDTLTGGAGVDVYVVTAGGGADTVIDFVVGTDLIDLSAFGGYQTIAQLNADTIITFAAGVTLKLIGVTASTVTAASFIGLPPPPSYNLINGTAAGETINGTAAADEIHGLAGADTISGGLGDDLLVGGTEADIFVATAGGGDDTISDFTVGGDKIDVTAFGSIVGVTQVGADALVQVSAGVSFLLSGVSAAAIGSSSFIGLPPPPPFNVINGTAGAENLYGTSEADHILAGDSADRAYGAGGDDWLEGQVGADKLYGEEGADLVVGGAGGDYLYGGDDDDTLEGGDDVDRLYGEAGDDLMDGGLGNDLLYGGAGSDTMTGGGGNDTFFFGEGEFGPLGDPDRITDWSAGDKINLSAVDANTTLAGDQAFVIVSSFTNAAGQLVVTYNAGTNETLAQLDVNGDGVADYALVVDGAATLAWVL